MTKSQITEEFATLTAFYQDNSVVLEAIQAAAQRIKQAERETIQAKNAKARSRAQQEVR